MSRSLDTTLEAAISAGLVYPVRLISLQFRTQTVFIWSGPGPLTWGGMTFTGVGSLGSIGPITEGTEINAEGTTVTLSGIDPVLLAESLTDIQQGAAATIWFGLVDANRNIIGTPYRQWSGAVDTPSVTPGVDTISITLNLESRLIDHARPNMSRYDSADQRLRFPTDSSMGWVEQLGDVALRWGM